MIESMKRVLSGEEAQEEGKKPVKPQDLARLYETIIQARKNIYNFYDSIKVKVIGDWIGPTVKQLCNYAMHVLHIFFEI